MGVIRLSRLDGSEFVLNVHLIETVEAVPDTVVSLVSGRKLVVRESVDELVRRAVAYHQAIWPGLKGIPGRSAGEEG